MGLPMGVVGKLEEAMAANGPELPKVIWLNGANCSGCTVSLANLFSDTGPADVADLLFNTIDLAFHPTLMAAAGDLAVQQLNDTAAGNYILAVDGGIPTAFGGNTCLLWTDGDKEVTALEAVEMLAPNASAVLSIGTCASYGGIPAGNPNPTGIVSVEELIGSKTINIPGCPTHPDWIVWTVAHLISGQTPQLDDRNRPSALYGTKIHKICPRREQEEAKTFGVNNHCLKELGCKGPETYSDCPSRKWNSGTNWCIGAGGICIGCTEKDFPDKFSPFYKLEYKYNQYESNSSSDQNTGTNAPLEVSKVTWDSDAGKLYLEGTGTSGQIVRLYNNDTGGLLGAVSVNASGLWKFTMSDIAQAPSTVKVESGSEIVSSTVPGVSDGNPVPDNNTFEVTRAVWRDDTLKFIVKGKGDEGKVVEMYNISTGNKVGKTEVQSDASWRIVVKRPVTVPCSVLLTCGSQEIITPVKKAPADCI